MSEETQDVAALCREVRTALVRMERSLDLMRDISELMLDAIDDLRRQQERGFGPPELKP